MIIFDKINEKMLNKGFLFSIIILVLMAGILLGYFLKHKMDHSQKEHPPIQNQALNYEHAAKGALQAAAFQASEDA